ncbi:MAG TPA: shikimate kinase [Phycisphaerae bacterium]|nr:shikimate kinase [Phycisphaerae bacterium]HPP22653.1 shikimate kinase [Phycisphaerae bacterium]HPU34750.1 shikimate kinase [Phycisphaerae bacterium]HQA46040.1 shikimate kinase [Phycisphaerae bacterium]HQE44787.1 shikimate kinase [Phycisphaerae bacterium]
MNVVLIGYRGSGKSAVGRTLASRLGWPFVDTDALIEQREGLTIREIFADRAEDGFRDLEARIIAEVGTLDRHVISTGGGAVLREENVAALKRNGRLVWLTAPPEVLWQRILGDIRRQETRPRMDLSVGLQQVREAIRERNPIYQRVADAIVDTTDRPVESIVERILTRTRLREDH